MSNIQYGIGEPTKQLIKCRSWLLQGINVFRFPRKGCIVEYLSQICCSKLGNNFLFKLIVVRSVCKFVLATGKGTIPIRGWAQSINVRTSTSVNVKQFLSWALKDPHFKISSYFSANLTTFSLFVILLYYFPCQIVLYA